jgi:hypothetical protein
MNAPYYSGGRDVVSLDEIASRHYEKVKKGLSSTNHFMTMDELEQCAIEGCGEINKMFMDNLQNILKNVDEKALIKKKS